MSTYNYTKSPVDLYRLEQEIRQSSIITALDYCSMLGEDQLSVIFKAELSSQDKTTLDGIVASHTGEPLAEAPQPVTISGEPAIKVRAQPPFGSKVIDVGGATKKLFARYTGLQFQVAQGQNTLEYTATYLWAKIIGMEVVNCEALDTVDFKVYDTAEGTYSGVPNALLNQFSYTLNLTAGLYRKMSQFDADLYQGMIIKITYNSLSSKMVGFNLILNEVKD